MLIYIIKKLFPNKFINYLREKKIILNWYLKNKPTSPPHSIKQKTIKKYAKKYNIKTFIETGTYKGEMIEATKNIFKKIYSIELDNDLWTKAIEKFKDDKYIKILNGDSGEILPKLLKKINNPCIFWLDGHYSGGITARGELNTPIFKELEAVLNHKIKNHVILIG